MAWWPTEPGSYTARNPKPRHYRRGHWMFSTECAARQWFAWKCWMRGNTRITVHAARKW